MTGLIDIGANLAHESFAADRTEVVERAWQAGLAQIIITGSTGPSSRAALDLARMAPERLFATAGLHPHHASDWNPELRALFVELAAQPEVVALGECGLDYYRNYAPPSAQRAAFEAQLALAAEQRKPVFLHQREAHADFLPMLRAWRAALPGAVVHCFTDNAAALDAYLDLDCAIGITGWICDERRGTGLYELAPRIPDDRLLIETDAPYLLPRNAPKARERRNEPAYLPWVLRQLAAARGQSEAHVAAVTTANARRLFGLPGGAAGP